MVTDRAMSDSHQPFLLITLIAFFRKNYSTRKTTKHLTSQRLSAKSARWRLKD